jgi:formiminoglutamase
VVPFTHPAAVPDVAADRLASRLHRLPVGCRVGLLGIPDDTGVRLNHGRPGAADGPAAFRAALAKYGVAEPDAISFPRIFDAGNVQPADGHSETALHETHRRVSEASAAMVRMGLFPVAVGGGHDLTFPFVRGVLMGLEAIHGQSARSSATGVLYFDAHLDVRDTVGSGMPFRRLIQDCGVNTLACVGFNPLANSSQHVRYFREHGGHTFELGSDERGTDERCTGPNVQFARARRTLDTSSRLAVSFDLDAIDASHAPGVSALNPAGLSVRESAGMVREICGDPRVICFDLMELCPAHDEQERTARVAAHLFLHAMIGLARRLGGDGDAPTELGPGDPR